MLLLSPEFGKLIRCLSGGLSVTFELFSPELTPLSSDADDRTLAAIRQIVATGEDETVRKSLMSTRGARAKQRITTPAMVVDLRPIRDGLLVVGLVAAATPRGGDTTPAERYMDTVGEAIQQLLEADVQTTRADRMRDRQSTGWLRLLGYLPSLASEAELLDVFLQALAVSHDLDARVYVRDIRQRFTLAAKLPGDEDGGPPELPSDLIERQWPARISSVAEIGRLGWYGSPYELTLIPIGHQHEAAHDATHVVTIRGILDSRIELAILTGCRILGVHLDRAEGRESRRIEERLSGRLHDIGVASVPTLTPLIQGLVDDLARWIGVTQGVFHADGPLTPGEAAAEANRLLVPLRLPGPARAIEFSNSSGVPFTVRQARLAQAGATLLTHWLLGLNQATQLMEGGRHACGDVSGDEPRAI